MSSWRLNWVKEKCEIAKRLSIGEAGGSYAESAIILCSVLSALASEIWPGTRIDRNRFIEMLVKFNPDTTLISVPLLIQDLESSGEISMASSLRHAFRVPKTALVVTGPDVDQCEDSILKILPDINLKKLRNFSYASLLYQEVRSGYAHEYQPGNLADSLQMTFTDNVNVSYVNKISEDYTPRRLVFFHLDWLLQLPVCIADAIDSMTTNLPLAKPFTWWAEQEQ